MEKTGQLGWAKLLEGSPWFNCDGCYPIAAYSEYMPPPKLGRTPLGDRDSMLFSEDEPFAWNISELEEENELRPGLQHAGKQIMHHIVNFGKGLTEHIIPGHGGQNLLNNPYWPKELADQAGKLTHEKFVVFLPLMLSKTQDDKGRVNWTLFGGSIHGPEKAFWKSFYNGTEREKSEKESLSYISSILEGAYGEKQGSPLTSGFKILPSGDVAELPSWTSSYIASDTSSFDKVRYLLAFRPFSKLPAQVVSKYFAGELCLLPFPGSLVFWGMSTYLKLQKKLPLAIQIPLLRLVARHRGVGSLRVTQSGWIHEPTPGQANHEMNHELVVNHFHRTHRWERIHRHQDELNSDPKLAKMAKVLFSTELDQIGLYDKPLARNSNLWSRDFDLLLDGPKATKKEIIQAEETILKGGLFGYRFYYPPMQVGYHQVFWHRPLVAYVSAESGEIVIQSDSLTGYLTAYHENDVKFADPVELWPTIQKRPLYLAAINDFHSRHDHYARQTTFNIITLFDSWLMQDKKPLVRTYAHKLLNLSKHKSLEQWLEELPQHANSPESGEKMKAEIEKIIEPVIGELPQAITFAETANRMFEVAWWNDINFLAHGDFINKDNADMILDEVTRQHVQHSKRDLEPLGDYLIERHKNAISLAGMEGKAFVGELPFEWQTDFDFSVFGGWKINQEGHGYERNILVVIPGKNRKEAIVLGDHYDTAYMEDIYEKGRGGSGARLSANGADDNYSATSTLLQAAPIFLKLAREGKLERDIWLIHLTGEEFPSDCLGARNFCQLVIEKKLKLRLEDKSWMDLSDVEVKGLYVMDMIAHNRDNDQDIFQISPGKSVPSLKIAYQAHLANMMWNSSIHEWNKKPDRIHRSRGKRSADGVRIPETAQHLTINGEVRTRYNPHSSIFNTDGQIFSDVGIPVVLFMENYDINRSGYHDTKDTMENIDLDYGAAFASIAIESVARVAYMKEIGF
jgi:hypothetical protein